MNPETALLKRFFPFFIFFGGALILTLDQLIKYKIRLSGGFYICNKEMSLGLPFFPYFFWLTLIFLLVVTFLYLKKLSKRGAFKPFFILAITLILGGAVANCVDRIIFGCIIDYIFLIPSFLPVFNIADISIFLGASLILLGIYKKELIIVDKL